MKQTKPNGYFPEKESMADEHRRILRDKNWTTGDFEMQHKSVVNEGDDLVRKVCYFLSRNINDPMKIAKKLYKEPRHIVDGPDYESSSFKKLLRQVKEIINESDD